MIIEAVELASKGLGKNVRIKNNNIRWLPSGKPVVRLPKTSDLGISLSHSGSFLLCVAGGGLQGCDIEEVIQRSQKQWLSLLGKKDYEALNEFVPVFGDLDHSGTAIWSARETLKKAGLEF